MREMEAQGDAIECSGTHVPDRDRLSLPQPQATAPCGAIAGHQQGFDWCVSGSLRPQFPSCDRCVCQQRIGAATSQLGGPRGLSGSVRRCTHRGGPLQ